MPSPLPTRASDRETESLRAAVAEHAARRYPNGLQDGVVATIDLALYVAAGLSGARELDQSRDGAADRGWAEFKQMKEERARAAAG